MAALNNITSPPDIAKDDPAIALKKVENYLYSLQEQLRFMFSNLGVENLNNSSLSELETLLTGGVKTQIQDAVDNVADLRLAADGLQLSFSDAEGNLSSLQQDVTGLTSTVESHAGDLSNIHQDVTGLTSTVESHTGDLSNIHQDVTGLTTTVQSQNGAISELTQTVDGLSLTVKDSEGNPSTVNISSGQLDLQGLVFNVLGEDGATEIDGGNIKTNTLNADVINGGTISGADFKTISSYSYTGSMELHDGTLTIFHGSTTPVLRLTYDDFGGVYLLGLGECKFSIYSSFNLDIGADDDICISADSKLDLTSNNHGIRVNYNQGNPLVVPIQYGVNSTDGITNKIDLGCGTYRFKGIYLNNAPNVFSDERGKKEINNIDAKQACAFVDALNVISYLYKTDEDDHKKRIGLLAGKMKDIDPDFAEFFVDEEDDHMLGLRPSDLVFALIPKIQAQQQTIDELKDKVTSQQQTIVDLFVNVEALKSRIALL
jgi:hypothetical protein